MITNQNLTFFTASELFRIAKTGHERALSIDSKNLDSLVTVVFASATLEAFINQSIKVASDWKHLNPKLKAYAELMGDMQTRTGTSIQSKYSAARWILTGETYDRSCNPYQDFQLLIRIRNALIHLEPDTIGDPENPRADTTEAKLLSQLQSRKLIKFNNPPMRHAWTGYLRNPQIAKWSCNTASAMIQGFWKGTDEKVNQIFWINANAAHYTAIP